VEACGPLAELVCESTEYELDLERSSRKEGYKSYDIQ